MKTRKILTILICLITAFLFLSPKLLFKTFKTDSFNISIPRWWQTETVAPLTRIFDSKDSSNYQIEIYVTPTALSLTDFISAFDQFASYSAQPQRVNSQVSKQPVIIETGLLSGSPYVSYYLKNPAKDIAYIITFGGEFPNRSYFVKYLTSSIKFIN
ncbi:MAG: hypothetical protein G01um101416_1071 [Microgenomates group bacterium Gr01-1014_16]|nr:MAG: hypothetical protein G01um101416_1071 [Microgenomates group bacterium Gr01-1014_16]